MRECSYKDGSAHIEFNLPNSNYFNSFKVDTGAVITLLPQSEFKRFFTNKKLEDGIMKHLNSASGTPMIGYTHRVLIHIIGCEENRVMNICFYNGARALFGMDMIKAHFRICFEKDKFFMKIN
ncbi:MAG: hypothetical protein QM493_10155 [Sulfurovum sp.]